MTKVAEIERIRWAHFREAVSIRELARTFHHSRTTIRRALADPGPWSYRRQRPAKEPVMGPVAEIVKGWLEDDLTRPRKQRHTAKRIWERLVAEYGFKGGQSTVRQWVREHRPTNLRKLTLPLAHDACAEAQLDFGEAQVRIAGVETTVQLFCARLAYSTRDVVHAYPRQDRPAWLDGHVQAFHTWGGAPACCWYDNPSGLGWFRAGRFEPCDEFLALQSAFSFRAHHCNPGEAHEKGLVEGLVGYARRNYLTPIPNVADLAELNGYLAEKTAAEESLRRQGQTAKVGERFRQERPLLAPLPNDPSWPVPGIQSRPAATAPSSASNAAATRSRSNTPGSGCGCAPSPSRSRSGLRTPASPVTSGSLGPASRSLMTIGEIDQTRSPKLTRAEARWPRRS